MKKLSIFYLNVSILLSLTSTTLQTAPTFNAQNLGAFAISVDLFLYIYELLPEGSTILELGSGTGTAELARYYNVYSIEHDQKWMDLYNTEYIFAPIKNYKGYKWYDVSHLTDKLPKQYDLILIDGPPGPSVGRYGFFHHMDLFNCNVPIIFDDAQRKVEGKLCRDVAKKLNRSLKFFKCSDGKTFSVILPD